MVGREARNNGDGEIRALANRPVCRACADALMKKGVRIIGTGKALVCSCGEQFTLANECAVCFAERQQRAEIARQKRAAMEAREAYQLARGTRKDVREAALAQIAFEDGDFVEEAACWKRALEVLPVIAKVTTGKKNGNGKTHHPAISFEREVNAETTARAIAGAREVIANGMPKVDPNAVRALRAQWEAANKPAAVTPKKSKKGGKHGGKQHGANRNRRDPQEQMGQALRQIRAMA
jgi:hypothetical protein